MADACFLRPFSIPSPQETHEYIPVAWFRHPCLQHSCGEGMEKGLTTHAAVGRIRPLLASFLRETHDCLQLDLQGQEFIHVVCSFAPGHRRSPCLRSSRRKGASKGLGNAGPFRVCASRSLFARSPLAGVSAAGQPPPSPMDGFMRLPREGNAQRGNPKQHAFPGRRGRATARGRQAPCRNVRVRMRPSLLAAGFFAEQCARSW